MSQPNIQSVNLTSKGKLAELLGIELIELEPDRVVATMPVTENHHQPMGILHGGASVALAETVASVGAWLRVAAEGKYVVGMEINANHLRPIRSGTVTAIGVPLHVGKKSQVWEIRIQDESAKLVCVSRCTLAVLEGG